MQLLFDAYAGNISLGDWVQYLQDQSVVADFYANDETLAELINARIQARTPVLTGALVSSEKYDVNHDPSSQDLVVFYASDAEQLNEWKRVYVEYQEGGALGKPTYTNAPHEMYAKVQTEDIGLIEQWGQDQLGNTATRLATP